MRRLILILVSLVTPAVIAASPGIAAAATQVIVTPTNQQGWSTADTRPGGAVNFIADSTAPGSPNAGALQLTTDLSTTAKAQYLHNTLTRLNHVTDLSYWTKQNSPVGPVADPSYQLVMCLNGVSATGCNPQSSPATGSSFTTLVYEPYQGGQGVVVNNTWQNWNIDSTGLFWSTRTVKCAGGVVVGTPGGPSIYTVSAINAMCPHAVVVQFGVNIGSNNPGYNVETDLFSFNGTVYNFEPAVVHPH